MKPLSCILFGTLALVSISDVAAADDFACNEAISAYNLMLVDHSAAFKKYADCLNMSRGKDTCSIEFGRLKRSQADYEMDVDTINQTCSSY